MSLARTPVHSDNTESRVLTRSQLNLYTQNLNEKEAQLTAQAETLRNREENLLTFQRTLEQDRNMEGSSATGFSEQLAAQLTLMERLSEQVTNIGRRMNIIEHSTNMQEHYDRVESQRPPTPIQNSPIRLKDAIDTIPKFDGHKMSVFHFTKICERALQLIPEYQEYHLVQLIINKLQGHAYAAVEGVEFNSLRDLMRRLKLIFGTNKSVDQHRGELANIFMKANENIFDYIARVQELRTAIIDGEADICGYLEDEIKDNIEKSVTNSFINGLPSDLLVRVKLERHYTLEQNIVAAIQLSKTLEAENLRKRNTIFNRAYTLPRADINYSTARQTVNNVDNNPPIINNPRNNNNTSTTAPFIKPLVPGQPGPNYPAIKICRYCKSSGHFMSECRKLAYRKSVEQSQAQPNTSFANSGNPQGVPEKSDVRRNEAPIGRTQPTNMILTQQSIPTIPLESAV
jgi:hypothetical protein